MKEDVEKRMQELIVKDYDDLTKEETNWLDSHYPDATLCMLLQQGKIHIPEGSI